jgi:hypothetical protein
LCNPLEFAEEYTAFFFRGEELAKEVASKKQAALSNVWLTLRL